MNTISKIISVKLIVLLSILVASCFLSGDVVSNLTLFAGQQKSTINGNLSVARFSSPLGITSDNANNIYVSEPTNHIIRKISAGGVVTTYAGKERAAGNTNGNREESTFMFPSALAFDKTRNFLYVVDAVNTANRHNTVIRRIDATGSVINFAGTAESTDGNVNDALLNASVLDSLVIDSKGNLYLTVNQDHIIKKITPSGKVTTYAGIRGQAGNLDGPISTATFKSPKQMVVDSNDNILISTNNSLRKITPAGEVTTIFTATTETENYFFYSPTTLTIDSNNNLYAYAAFNQNKIGLLKMAPNGQITPFFEIDLVQGEPRSTSDLIMGVFLTVDVYGNILLADTTNSVIRKFQPNGTMVNLGQPLMGSVNSNNGLKASFSQPNDFSIDQNGNIVIADSANNLLRKVTPQGQVSTLSGRSGELESRLVNGNALDSRFHEPTSITYNAAQNNFYVADNTKTIIRKVFSDGSTTTFAGGATSPFQDGQGTNSSFNRINAITMNPSNTFIFLADGNRIRKVDMNGVVSTVYNLDNNLLGWNIDSIVADSSDNIFVVSEGTLYKITASGMITAVYQPTTNESINVLGIHPTPLELRSVKAIDPSGNFYLQYCANTELLGECEIRKLNAQANTLTSTGVKANAVIKAFKFDKHGQAYALVENALFKAKIN